MDGIWNTQELSLLSNEKAKVAGGVNLIADKIKSMRKNKTHKKRGPSNRARVLYKYESTNSCKEASQRQSVWGVNARTERKRVLPFLLKQLQFTTLLRRPLFVRPSIARARSSLYTHTQNVKCNHRHYENGEGRKNPRGLFPDFHYACVCWWHQHTLKAELLRLRSNHVRVERGGHLHDDASVLLDSRVSFDSDRCLWVSSSVIFTTRLLFIF